MKNKRILTAAVSLMAALSLVFAFGSCTKKTTPTQYAFNAIEATAKSVLPTDIAKLIASAEKSGEAEIILKGNETTASIADIDNASIKINYGKDAALASLALTMDGKNADLKLWQNGNKLALSSSLIGDGIYSVDLEKGKDSYLSSVFGKADSDYSLIGIFGENGEFFDTLKKNAEVSKNLTALAGKYKDLLVKSFEANAKTELKNNTAVIELNNESISNIIKELYNAAKNDSELRSLLDTLMSSNGQGGTALPDIEGEDEAVYGVSDIDSFFDSDEQLNEMLENLNETDISIILTVSANKKNVITKATLDVVLSEKSESDDETVDKIVFGAILDLTDASKKTLELSNEEFSGEESEGKETTLLSYNIKENSKEKYSASLSYKRGNFTVDNCITLDLNRVTGEYSFSPAVEINSAGVMTPYVISGVIKYDSKSLTVTVTSLNIGTSLPLDLTFKFTTGVKAPEFPSNTTDLFTLDETGVAGIIEDFGKNLGDLGILG